MTRNDYKTWNAQPTKCFERNSFQKGLRNANLNKKLRGARTRKGARKKITNTGNTHKKQLPTPDAMLVTACDMLLPIAKTCLNRCMNETTWLPKAAS